jgi:hypothetical protein
MSDRTLGEAMNIAASCGRMSKRAQRAANRRWVALCDAYDREWLASPECKALQAAEAAKREAAKPAALLRAAADLRALAARGIKPRAYVREAERLEALAREPQS